MSMHATRVCKSANYYLHCIRKIRNCLSLDICKLLVHAHVTVHLDYGNTCCVVPDIVLSDNLSVYRDKLPGWSVKKIKFDMHTSVTELLWGLHWFPIHYNLLLLVYKAFTTSKPSYLSDMLASKKQVRSIRTSLKVNILDIPKTIPNNGYTVKTFSV